MTLLIHPKDLTELQQYLLSSYLYFELIGELDAAKIAGEKFDKIY